MTRARDLAAFVSNADGDIKFDTDTLFIDSSANRVGIGETAPATNLHISSTANPAISIEDTDNGFAASTIQVENGGRDLDITVPQDIIFTNGSDEAMRITSADNVAIGTTSAVLTSGNRGNLTISGTAGSILNLAESGSQGTYLFHRSNDVDVFNTTNGYMRFGTNNAERMRILSGGGLTFNGDTAAANALDDYEEGTGTFGVASGTMSGNSYTYTKIGRLCYVQSVISGWSDYTSGNSLELTGLPFTATTTGHAAGSSMGNLNSSGKHIAYINGNSRVLFYHSTTGSGYNTLKHSELPSSGSIHLFLTYQTT